MEKKLIALYVPAVQECFDLLVPTTLEIAALTALLAQGVQELCEGHFVISHQETLSLRQGSLPLCPDKTLADYGIQDGTQMVLV